VTEIRGRRLLSYAAVAGLLLVLTAQLGLSIRRESQTWDEGCHIYAGYAYWTRFDFGVNPEHPPLVKLVATLPLLGLPLHPPTLQDRYFKVEAFLEGKEFLYSNDADSILLRTRLAAAIFTLFLVLLVFVAAREMFGLGTALLASALLVFEPNLLAHGALVTTDVGLSCCLWAVVYALYRYAKQPSVPRLVIVGLAAGLVLAAKHSGVLVLPILFALVITEFVLRLLPVEPSRAVSRRIWWEEAVRGIAALAAIIIIAVAVLWAFYGFRFAARPSGLEMNPPLAAYTAVVKPLEGRVIRGLAQWHILPEAYLYGLTDVRNVANNSFSYLFGKVYPHGQWFYFPAAFVIKSTLPFLILVLLAPMALVRWKEKRRQILFLTLPPAIYFLQAMTSGLNIGARHILPIYPFLATLAAAAAGRLISHNRRWVLLVAPLVLWHAVSSLRAFPTYLAYSNELWGGPSQTYRYLTDSNADWGQQLKATKRYLDQHRINDCWFAYFVETVVDPSYYGIPCKPLPVISSLWLKGKMDVPASIDGPVLISAGTLSGYEFGPGELNPYEGFKKVRPMAQIDDGIFVFEGPFEIPLAAALHQASLASDLLANGQLEEALAHAQTAVHLAPKCVRAQAVLGDVLVRMGRKDEGRAAYQRGLSAATANYPEFQEFWVEILQRKLAD
jgi:tetratricopeptide (TPR) repeat protein